MVLWSFRCQDSYVRTKEMIKSTINLTNAFLYKLQFEYLFALVLEYDNNWYKKIRFNHF